MYTDYLTDKTIVASSITPLTLFCCDKLKVIEKRKTPSSSDTKKKLKKYLQIWYWMHTVYHI